MVRQAAASTAISSKPRRSPNMRGSTTIGAAFFAVLAAAGPYPPDEVDKLATSSLPKLQEYLKRNPQGECTLETAVRRKEWYGLFPTNISVEPASLTTEKGRPQRTGTQGLHRRCAVSHVQAGLDECSGARGQEQV